MGGRSYQGSGHTQDVVELISDGQGDPAPQGPTAEQPVTGLLRRGGPFSLAASGHRHAVLSSLQLWPVRGGPRSNYWRSPSGCLRRKSCQLS